MCIFIKINCFSFTFHSGCLSPRTVEHPTIMVFFCKSMLVFVCMYLYLILFKHACQTLRIPTAFRGTSRHLELRDSPSDLSGFSFSSLLNRPCSSLTFYFSSLPSRPCTFVRGGRGSLRGCHEVPNTCVESYGSPASNKIDIELCDVLQYY